MADANGAPSRPRRARASLLAVLIAALVIVGAASATAATNATAGSDIIGGTPTAPGQLPSLAYILFTYTSGQHYSCTGTVVAPTLVLTAAHCGYALPSQYRIVIGAPDLDASADADLFRVSAVSRDPAWARVPGTDDAALLTLKRPTTAPPVQLAAASVTAGSLGDTTAQIAGWGATVAGQAPTTDLQSAITVIQPADYCSSQYSDYDPSKQLCAVDYPTDTAATCSGDSGGPLLSIAPGRRPVQVGIVGFGPGDCDPSIPDFYTSVAAVAPWLSAQIAQAPIPRPALTTTAARRTVRRAVAVSLSATGAGPRPARGLRSACSRRSASAIDCLVSFRAGARSYVGTVDVVARWFLGAPETTGTFALRSYAASCRAGASAGATACTTHLSRGQVGVALS